MKTPSFPLETHKSGYRKLSHLWTPVDRRSLAWAFVAVGALGWVIPGGITQGLDYCLNGFFFGEKDYQVGGSNFQPI